MNNMLKQYKNLLKEIELTQNDKHIGLREYCILMTISKKLEELIELYSVIKELEYSKLIE